MAVGDRTHQLPSDSFIAGESHLFVFNCFYYADNRPFSLARCTASFSIVHAFDKEADPILTKPMTVEMNVDRTTDSRLHVTLLPAETVDLHGKYIYQVSVRDVSGDIEIPGQGELHIYNNIDKNFI